MQTRQQFNKEKTDKARELAKVARDQAKLLMQKYDDEDVTCLFLNINAVFLNLDLIE